MPTPAQPDAIFDFDGVLADSVPLIVQILDRLLRLERNLSLTDAQLRAAVGPPFRGAVAHLCSLADLSPDDSTVDELVEAFRSEYAVRAPAETPMVPGIATALAALQQTHRLSICSSKPRPLVEGILATWNAASWFAAVEAPRPDSDEPKTVGLTRLIAELSMNPKQSTLIGDTRFDIDASRAVGIRCIGVAWGVATADDLLRGGAEAIANHPAELPALLTTANTR